MNTKLVLFLLVCTIAFLPVVATASMRVSAKTQNLKIVVV